MPLDPQVKEMLDVLALEPLPTIREQGPEEARRFMRLMAPAMAIHEEVDKVEDRRVPGRAGEIPVRVYTPRSSAPFPALVFFHGGGWVIGDIETHDALCRALANAAGAVVVSVDYRLAPEHRYPAAVEDAYAAAVWTREHAAELSADREKVCVGGDSAGGNLAAVVALMARDRGAPSFACQLLLYPVTDHDFETASYRENAEGYFLTREDMMWFWEHYLSDESQGAEAYASPLRAKDFSGLPPALVVTAEYDPLRDEGEEYARRLEAAGVRARLLRYDGMIHGFLRRTRGIDLARVAIREIGEHLGWELGE